MRGHSVYNDVGRGAPRMLGVGFSTDTLVVLLATATRVDRHPAVEMLTHVFENGYQFNIHSGEAAPALA
jgi:hypothetical protein